MERRRIIIIDDHPLLAEALQGELQRSGAAAEVLDPAIGPEQLLETICSRRPDCAVLDLGLPFPGGGSDLIEPLADHEIRVVILTGETERPVLARSLGAGAAAVLCKSEPLTEIVDTILQVSGGHAVRTAQRAELAVELQRLMAERAQRDTAFAALSRRERQVLAGLMDGLAPSDLAEQNFVSIATVRSQIKSVLSKLGVNSQLAAVARAHESGWRPDARGL